MKKEFAQPKTLLHLLTIRQIFWPKIASKLNWLAIEFNCMFHKHYYRTLNLCAASECNVRDCRQVHKCPVIRSSKVVSCHKATLFMSRTVSKRRTLKRMHRVFYISIRNCLMLFMPRITQTIFSLAATMLYAYRGNGCEADGYVIHQSIGVLSSSAVDLYENTHTHIFPLFYRIKAETIDVHLLAG